MADAPAKPGPQKPYPYVTRLDILHKAIEVD